MTTNDVLFKVIASIDKLYEFRGEKHDDQEERRRNGFDIEFSNLKNLSAGLKQSKEHVTNAGMIAENKKKNRYKDIMPFDVSRVKLDVIKEDSNSDYINASFVDGVGCSRAYVASQGPLPHTLLDFWRMLWQYNIHVIVMVCRQVEMGKRKCEKYWADQEEVKQFGDITVTLSDSQNPNTSYCIRTLKAERENETRYIRQFHYVCWPDHGVPKTCYEILQMINHIREFQPYSRDAEIPLCVHCSAGCGRTGAVLAVDYARNLLDKKKVTSGFSVYDIVCNMRKQRPAIVQTRDQYEFVNAAISEMFKIYMQTRSLKHKDFVKQAQVGAYENVILPVKSTSNSGEAKVIQEPKVAEHLATRSYENIEFVHRQMHNAHTENGNDRASSPSKEHADDKPPAKPGRIISNNLSRPTSAYVVSTSPANPTHGVLGSGYGLGREDRRPSIPNSLGLSKISNGNAKAQGRHRTPLSASNFNAKDVSPKPSPVGTPPRVKPILNIEAATMHKTEGAKSPGKVSSMISQGNPSPVRTQFRLLSLQSTTTSHSVSMSPNTTQSNTFSQALPKQSTKKYPAGDPVQFWKPVTIDKSKHKLPKSDRKADSHKVPWSYKLDRMKSSDIVGTITNEESANSTRKKGHSKDMKPNMLSPKVSPKPEVKPLQEEIDSLTRDRNHNNKVVTSYKVNLRAGYGKKPNNVAYRVSMFEVSPVQDFSTNLKKMGAQKRSMSTSNEDSELPESVKIDQVSDKYEGRSKRSAGSQGKGTPSSTQITAVKAPVKNSELSNSKPIIFTNPSYGPVCVDKQAPSNVGTAVTHSTPSKAINYTLSSPKPFKSKSSGKQSFPKNSNMSKSQDSVHLLDSVNSVSFEPKTSLHSSMSSLLSPKVQDRQIKPNAKKLYVNLEVDSTAASHNTLAVTYVSSKTKTYSTTNTSASHSPTPKPRKTHTVVPKNNDTNSMNSSYCSVGLTLEKGTGECTTQKPPLAPKIMIAPKIASPVESTKPKAPVKPRRTVKKANSYQQKASSLSDDGPPEPQKGTPPASSSSVQGNLAKYKRNHLYNDIDLSPGKNPSIVPETEYDTIRDRRVIPRSNSSSSVERNRSQTPKPRNPNRSTGDTPPRLPNRTAESRVMISESPPALPDRTEDSYITIAESRAYSMANEAWIPNHVDGEEDHQPYEAVSSTPIIPETKPAENGRRGSSNPSTSLAAKAKGMLGKTTSAFSKVGASISKTLEDESTSQRPPTMSERSPTYVQVPVIYGGQDMSFGKRLVKKVKGTRKLK